ncbi:MAG: hypothetical protein E7435_05585 [Ruminococcaceae bacterium]|nr:hypothetical protein [Oscillospiraceae bacterium]
MKMRSVLSILLVICLMASFVVLQPVRALAAEENLEGEQNTTDTVPEGDSAGENETAPEEGKNPLLSELNNWAENGLPWQVQSFMTAFDNFFGATWNFAGTLVVLIKYIAALFV